MSGIILDEVFLSYPVYGGNRSFRKALFSGPIGGLLSRTSHGDMVIVDALKQITLSVKDGDRIGLIGPNGAGKSTLLRVMAGIYQPTSGSITIDGKVSTLFNTSLGMDPDLSGYDNIVHMGMYIGLDRKECVERAPEIAEFTGLGDFIHLPVRIYSSGMSTRLSFAIATMMEPGILLLDEGLGTGDADFTARAGKRIDELMEKSSALVLATHSNELMRQICTSAFLLSHGEIVGHGNIEDVIGMYDELIA